MKKLGMARALRIPSSLSILALAFCSAFAAGQTSARSGNAELMAQLHEAVSTAQRGDGNRALALAHALVVQHPEFEPAIKFQGALLEDMGHGVEAAASYQQALKLDPTDPELMYKVGVYQLVAGNKDEAISLFVHRLKLVPQDGDTLYYLAQAYHLKGDNDLALKTIKECVRVDPNNAAVWQKYGELLCSSGDNDAALKWLLKAQLDFDLGVASYKNMDLENAAHYATKAAESRPDDLNVLALLAVVEVKLARWQEAKPVFASILAVKSDDVPSLLGLGHCDLELKNYQQAADSLERLLQQDPTQILAHFYLSRAYAGLGRTADAQHEAALHSKMLEQASSVAPEGNSDLEKTTWREARQLLVDGHEAAALKVFEGRSRGLDATPGRLYILVGASYLAMGRTEDAQRVLEQALTVEPAVHDAHTYLGMVALQQADLDRAEREFKVELAADPNDRIAIAEIGEVRYRQGRWADAVDQLSRSRTMVPSLLYMLCDSYFQMGNVKDADLTAELLFDYAKGDLQVKQGVIDLLNRHQQTELAQRLSSKVGSTT